MPIANESVPIQWAHSAGSLGWPFSMLTYKCKKGKVFPYSLPSVGPGADPGVQAVSQQVT